MKKHFQRPMSKAEARGIRHQMSQVRRQKSDRRPEDRKKEFFGVVSIGGRVAQIGFSQKWG